MINLLLLTLLIAFRVDYTQAVISSDTTSQHQIIENLVHSSFRPPYRVARLPGPLRRSPFVWPPLSITAESGVLIDEMSGRVLWQRNTDAVLPVASLTKLATALVFLETTVDFSKEVTMEKSDEADTAGSRLQVKPGEILTAADLFYTSLIGSANNATKALARATDLPEEEFIRRMNEKAEQLGLEHTVFHEVTGLDPQNVSTVLDYTKLANYAFHHTVIREALNKSEYTFITLNTKIRHRIKNTDLLLSDDELHLIGAKTGYLEEAGFTFVAQSENDGHRLTVVLFKSVSSDQRFAEAKAILQWAYNNHRWL